jgi:hypothetical protein
MVTSFAPSNPAMKRPKPATFNSELVHHEDSHDMVPFTIAMGFAANRQCRWAA